MIREDLAGLIIDDTTAICGTPEEADSLLVQWTHSGSMMLSTLPSGLSPEQVKEELLDRARSIDEIELPPPPPEN